MYFLNFAVILGVIAYVQGETCVNPSVQEKYYTSTEKKMSDDTAFVVEFNLKCKNELQDLSLYADVDGKQYPVTKSPETNDYQVSWITKNVKAPEGIYSIRFFDDEGINALKKAVRNDQDTSGVKSLFTIDVKHAGGSKNFFLSSQVLALLVAGLLYYAVCQQRSEVLN